MEIDVARPEAITGAGRDRRRIGKLPIFQGLDL